MEHWPNGCINRSNDERVCECWRAVERVLVTMKTDGQVHIDESPLARLPANWVKYLVGMPRYVPANLRAPEAENRHRTPLTWKNQNRRAFFLLPLTVRILASQGSSMC